MPLSFKAVLLLQEFYKATNTQVDQLKIEEAFESGTITREGLWPKEAALVLLFTGKCWLTVWSKVNPLTADSFFFVYEAKDSSPLYKWKHKVDRQFLSFGVKVKRLEAGEIVQRIIAIAVLAWQPGCDTRNMAHDHTHIHISYSCTHMGG